MASPRSLSPPGTPISIPNPNQNQLSIIPTATNIEVLVRVRPLLSHESDEQDRGATSIVHPHTDNKTISITHPNKSLQCAYDRIFSPSDSQNEIYSHIESAATALCDGFNATIFAYGQTGSGKTHTMFGPSDSYLVQKSSYGGPNHANLSDQAGVIPRSIVQIFKQLAQKHLNITQSSVYVSFVQVYNEQLFDMLRDPRRSASLEIHEEPGVGIYVSGLSEYAVRNAGDCLALVKLGEENRAIRETHMNTASSRSHSLFQIVVEQTRIEDGAEGERVLKSKFNLVDLAGSEKWDTKKERHMQTDHLSELTNINLSLYTLGRCIAALAKNAKSSADNFALSHVPFRESKLTRLLQDSLGGNSKTMLIATLSPASDCLEETVSTLRFADRAHQVMTFVRLNEKRPVDHALVQRLQSECSRLRMLLAERGIEGGGLEEALDKMSDLAHSSASSSNPNSNSTNSNNNNNIQLKAAFERILFLETENNTLRKRLGMPVLQISKQQDESQTAAKYNYNSKDSNRTERAIDANDSLRYDQPQQNTPQRHTPRNFAIAGGGNSELANKIRGGGDSNSNSNSNNDGYQEKFFEVKNSHDRLVSIMSDFEGVTSRFFTFDIEEEELKKSVTTIMKVYKKERKGYEAMMKNNSSFGSGSGGGGGSGGAEPMLPPTSSKHKKEKEEGFKSPLNQMSGPPKAMTVSSSEKKLGGLGNNKLLSPGFSSSPVGIVASGAVKYRIRGKQSNSNSNSNKNNLSPASKLLLPGNGQRGEIISPLSKSKAKKSETTSSWIETEEEEEEGLKKELKAAKARMAKQIKMQEWLEKKEQTALKALEEEEASRKSFEDERKAKDKKFRQRAKKQKKKLEKYYSKLREEVENLDGEDGDGDFGSDGGGGGAGGLTNEELDAMTGGGMDSYDSHASHSGGGDFDDGANDG